MLSKTPSAIGASALSRKTARGVRLAADAANYGLTQYLYHYYHRQWSRQLVPSPRRYNLIFGMAWIPRIASASAVGKAELNRGNGSVGVITRYLH
jgi:hypothetical protein